MQLARVIGDVVATRKDEKLNGVTLLVLHYYPVLSSDLVIFVNGLTCGVAAHNLWVASQLERATPAD